MSKSNKKSDHNIVQEQEEEQNLKIIINTLENIGYHKIVFCNLSIELLYNRLIHAYASGSKGFPDFKFNNGYVEIFNVTSSIDNKKGSEQVKRDKQFENSYNKDLIRKFKDNLFSNPNSIYINSGIDEKVECSMEYLKKSFIKHWQDHLESCNKYIGEKYCGIFLINLIGSLPYYLKKNEYNENIGEFYKLSKDKELLEYIKNNREGIKYIIFIAVDRIELIDIDQIDIMLETCEEHEYISKPLKNLRQTIIL